MTILTIFVPNSRYEVIIEHRGLYFHVYKVETGRAKNWLIDSYEFFSDAYEIAQLWAREYTDSKDWNESGNAEYNAGYAYACGYHD